MNTKRFPIYQLKMAEELIKMGFNFEEAKTNKNNPKFKVYLFTKEEGLEEAVQKLAKSRR